MPAEEASTIPRFDVFVCHASEGKDAIARPLAEGLRALDVRVWYDEFSLRVGDSLWETINRGLAESRYGVVILSPAFVAKRWPRDELRGLVAAGPDGSRRILPVLHDFTIQQVKDHFPILGDTVALDSGDGVDTVVAAVADFLREARLPQLQEAFMKLVDSDRRVRALAIELDDRLGSDTGVGWYGWDIPPPDLAPLWEYLRAYVREPLDELRAQLDAWEVDVHLQQLLRVLRQLAHVLLALCRALLEGSRKCYRRHQGGVLPMLPSRQSLTPALGGPEGSVQPWEDLRETVAHLFRTAAQPLGISDATSDSARWPVWSAEAVDAWGFNGEGVWGPDGRPAELVALMSS